MEKYNFLVDGIPVSVYPLSEPREEREAVLADLCEGEIAVIILYDFVFDFRIECFDKDNNEPREPHIPLAALFYFFVRVRGYPDMTLNIEYHGREYEVDLKSAKEYSFAVNSGKCKILCANNAVFNDGVETLTDIIEARGSYCVYRCADAELVEEDRVELLLLRTKEKRIKAAMAISFSDRLCIKTAPRIPFYEAICVSLEYLYSSGYPHPYGECEAVVNGAKHKILITKTDTVFYPKIKHIL